MTKKQRLFIHIDADAFFASVEQCLHKELRGKPIVAGRDGSIAVALSYEAKALGVERATPIHIIRQDFPSVQMVASDYSMYRLFSDRMINIISGYLPDIKRKSIDECSCELTAYASSFVEAQKLAETIGDELETKMACTFSFGISTSPLLAKMASAMNKPSGITILDPCKPEQYRDLAIKNVPGLGRRLCQRLQQMGISKIGDFIDRYPNTKRNFSIVTDDIYQQLRGYPSTRNKIDKAQQSMNRARSFKVTNNKEQVFGQLVLNTEHLLRKLRAQALVCSHLYLSLGDAERRRTSSHIKLSMNTRDSKTIFKHLEELFNELWKTKHAYRYVSVTFGGLMNDHLRQADLFGEHKQEDQRERIDKAMDYLNNKVGKAVISRASSLTVPAGLGSHIDPARFPITERYPLLPNESPYHRVRYPFLGKI